MIDEKKFFAWLDGELVADEAAMVEREVAADPRLSELAREHRAMQAQLKGAFQQVAEAPVPERLIATLRAQPAQILDFAAARDRHKRRTPRLLPPWMPMAAMLAIGVFVGSFMGGLAQVQSSAPINVHDGRIYAASGLAEALDSQLASAPASGTVRIGVTFRDRSGAICRTFIDPQASGLACREGHSWQLRGLFATPEGQSSDYRMAAGMDPNLAALVDTAIAGEPLDAAQEKTARRNGWR